MWIRNGSSLWAGSRTMSRWKWNCYECIISCAITIKDLWSVKISAEVGSFFSLAAVRMETMWGWSVDGASEIILMYLIAFLPSATSVIHPTLLLLKAKPPGQVNQSDWQPPCSHLQVGSITHCCHQVNVKEQMILCSSKPGQGVGNMNWKVYAALHHLFCAILNSSVTPWIQEQVHTSSIPTPILLCSFFFSSVSRPERPDGHWASLINILFLSSLNLVKINVHVPTAVWSCQQIGRQSHVVCRLIMKTRHVSCF